MEQEVTAVPTALAGTVEDTQYFIKNEGLSPVYAAVASAAPATSAVTFSIEPLGFLYQTPGTGESIFVWRSPGILEKVTVAYDPAAATP